MSDKNILRVITFTLLLGFVHPTLAIEDLECWLPYSPAPRGEVGGLFSGEYEQFKIDNDDLAIRRVMLRMGWTPGTWASFWIDAGFASLYIEDANASMQGDFGGTFGLGGSFVYPSANVTKLSFFISSKGSWLNSKLGSDRTERGVDISTRSNYEQLLGTITGGVSYCTGKTMVFGGPVIKTFSLKEKRHTKNSAPSKFSQTNTYQSGIRPGVTIGIFTRMKHRCNIWAAVEVGKSSMQFTIAFGQWGAL
ncbi:MAG: hypothetical protein HQ568_11060 [Calditrichaeota bacterium]|nr:hypothetical protein [Calditrichota bacterium]